MRSKATRIITEGDNIRGKATCIVYKGDNMRNYKEIITIYKIRQYLKKEKRRRTWELKREGIPPLVFITAMIVILLAITGIALL